ncbi:alpha/beta hydrolase [Labrys monachus]|uniref:Esterase/lipase superfamily enzyme n=1 Tax=Labrys monachus TaxID=217067 RepID=A0ABU0FC09_9HYPH|nr:alpha/beta fold hydrolase [Labrys monachus]MDQ0392149.1 esterase/lipase superfamily enzyme [Labrys monachus]
MASFIRMFRLAAAALALVACLAACADRPGPRLLHPVADAAGVGTPVRVLMATTRQRSTVDRRDFTDKRNFGLSYEQYSISIPPTHVEGQIEWPSEAPGDPARNFVVLNSGALDEAGFSKALLNGRKSGEVAVFVHGYNTNYQEAVYRVAELSRDSGFPGTVVGFAWPSLGTLTGYVADREASTYSRDYFEEFLNDLARTPGVKRIHIIAHSMGNWLAVETLRQAKIRGGSAFLPKLGEVFLMSPDIDVDVFRTQIDAIGKLNEPITIGISRDDRALGASQRIAGDLPRLGNALADTPKAQEAMTRYNLRVIDMSDTKSLDAMNHGKFVSILPALSEVARNDAAAARGNPVSRTGLFVVNTAGTILQTPLRLGQAVLGQ